MLLIFSLPTSSRRYCTGSFRNYVGKKMRFLSLPSFRTYLYNSIRNASLNYLKHQNVESLYLERLASTYREITEEEDTNEEEIYRLLFRAIDNLPTRCREIFLLHMDGKKMKK